MYSLFETLAIRRPRAYSRVPGAQLVPNAVAALAAAVSDGANVEAAAEAAGHRSVGEHAARVVNALFTIGPLGLQMAAAARSAGARAVRHFDTKEEAVDVLRTYLRPDVLLVKASHGLALGAVVAELVG